MKLIKSGFSILCLSFACLVVQADSGEGKILHDQSCTACHDTSVYSRPDKRIKTLAELQGQVSRCTKPAGAEWSQQEVSNVVNYLNTDFYHFK